MPTLSASRLLTATGDLPHPLLALDNDGTLAILDTDPHPNPEDTTALTPAFLDIHTHGAVGEDVMSATPEGFARLQGFYATRGVAWYCPTTVTAPLDTTLQALDRIATEIERGPQPLQAQPIGIHLEGPFLSAIKRGVHPAEHLLRPDIPTFNRLHEAARGHIALLTLAPELPNALNLIRHAVSLGIRVSLGHSNATAAETLAALDAGATSSTHTFNAMRPLDHREPGILGTTLDDSRLHAEIIADGIHVAPPLIRLWYHAKSSRGGPPRAILVTDSMSAAGSPDGSYSLGGLPVTVRARRALLTGDLVEGKETLAGSILTLDTAVSNLRQHTACSLAHAVRAASHTPAAFLGRPELTTLAPGSPAHLNRFDQNSGLVATYIQGQQVPR